MQQAKSLSLYGGFGILPFGHHFAPAYLSDDYFTAYGTALDEARKLGMTLSLYDEYGFPSGSAGAQNSSPTSLFAQRYPHLTIHRLDKHEWPLTPSQPNTITLPAGQLTALVALNTISLQRIELSDQITANTLTWTPPPGPWTLMAFVCIPDGDPICDYLNPDAADKFIEITHQAYYDRFKEHFGTTIDSTFFDEPTLCRAQGRSWTPQFNEKFIARHGFDPRPLYPALWYDIGPITQAARNDLFGFRTELYANAFPRRIQEWSTAHHITATGHQDQEEILNPVSISGDLMKCFEYLDIPGIDKIGGHRPAERFYKIISSVAYNYDRPIVMSETYGAMGDLPWPEIYTIAMEQYTKGINHLIPHAVWYDTNQITFKPELSWSHPYYAPKLPKFNTFLARLNLLLQNNHGLVANIALLYPIATLQGSHHFDGPLGFYEGGVAVPEADYVDVAELLSRDIGLDYSYLHPDILDNRCTIINRSLHLPNRIHPARFSTLILPGHQTIRWSSLQKIEAFYNQGGTLIATGLLPSKSAEAGHDTDITETIQRIFDTSRTSLPFTTHTNAAGGLAIHLNILHADILRQALEFNHAIYDVSTSSQPPLRYIHKTYQGTHTYYFANLSSEDITTTLTLRGHHQLEIWNPHTGSIQPAPTSTTTPHKTPITQTQLHLAPNQSTFLRSPADDRQ